MAAPEAVAYVTQFSRFGGRCWRSLRISLGAGLPLFTPFTGRCRAIPAVSAVVGRLQFRLPGGLAFGAGLMGFGVFWMHISIDQFGNVGTLLCYRHYAPVCPCMMAFYLWIGMVGGEDSPETGGLTGLWRCFACYGPF